MTSENLPVLYENQCVDSLWQILNRALQESHRRSHPGVPPGYVVCPQLNYAYVASLTNTNFLGWCVHG